MQRSIHISKHLVMRRMACHWVLFACNQSPGGEQAERAEAQELVKAGGASRASGDREQEKR